MKLAAARLLLVSFLAAAAAPAVATPLEDGQHAFVAGRFDEARAIWTSLAEGGDAEAKYRLGLLYDVGYGVPEDAAAAFHWYRAAAEAGLPAAQFNVGVMLDSGRGAPCDRAQAALWYARAAARGHDRAQYNLAQLYEAGDGVPRNLDLAEAWYRATDLPAAARKLTLPRAARVSNPAAQPETTAVALTAPTLLTPVGQETIDAPGDRVQVELIWTAPMQPTRVRYYVSVMALDEAGLREVLAGYRDVSAILLELENRPGRYAWRVYAVDGGQGHYAASNWVRFSIVPPDGWARGRDDLRLSGGAARGEARDGN